MNPVETLRERIRVRYPAATIELTPPLRSDGVWSLDVDLADKKLAIEWSEKTGFGLSEVSDENFGEAPDETVLSIPEAESRISELLTTSHRTSPRVSVLLSRLRQRVGLTQRELARRLGVQQATISGMERRSDIQISTLQRVIRALGGALEVFAVFPHGRYRIDCSPASRSAGQSSEGIESAIIDAPSIDYEHAFERLNEAGDLLKARSSADRIRSRHAIIEFAD